jgi:hypothetical protein
VNEEAAFDKETVDGAAVETRGSALVTILSYGVAKDVDLIVGIPYVEYSVKVDGATVADEGGLSDSVVEVKWRFFEKDGFALALKPGASIPTGDSTKGLGTGKTDYGVFLIASKELDPLTFLVNLGYVRNENIADEQVGIWRVSAAAMYKATEQVTIVANIRQETNTDKNADKDRACALAGVIYAVSESFDLDFGVKAGLNKAEPDVTYLAGFALRF